MKKYLKGVYKNIKDTNLNRLIFIAGFIVLVSTIGFGIIIPKINSEIASTQQEISNITKELDMFEFNAKMQSDQLVKLTSTYGDFKILDTLNSSYINEFKNHIKRQMYQSIAISRGRGINSTEKMYLETLNFERLEKEVEMYLKDSTNSYNKVIEDKKDIENRLINLIKKRDWYNLIFVIIQIIGLSLGIIGNFYKTKTE